MGKHTIRQANKNDIVSLAVLAVETYVLAFGESFTSEELAQQLEAHLSEKSVKNYITKDVVLLAEVENKLLGYIHLSEMYIDVETPISESKYLQRLYVHPDYQGQGLGSALIAAGLKHPFVKDSRYVYLDVWEKNVGAIRLYERHSFKRYGEVRYVHADGTEGDLDYILQFDKGEVKGER